MREAPKILKLRDVEYVPASVAAIILGGISARSVERLCQRKIFKSAFKPSVGDKGARNCKWMILRAEVVAHKFSRHCEILYS